ncbi:type II toxin-antitoxin system Phd/YefM family antitoxin [Lactiplantibacillus daowaiensis]|uniref:Antitoxin n=1 Tax=Lactiplantibacillus daowaiensis TaxID=2559918 RepID=A0ABW1S2S5_9LACO
MKETFTPTSARKDFYHILKQVAEDHQPITIQQKDENLDAIIISKSDYEALQETLYLANTGTLAKVKQREADNSGFTNVDDIDWENL